MTLKNLSKINFIISLLFGLIMLPFYLCKKFFFYIESIFESIFQYINSIRHNIGNILLNISDEAREGKIKNTKLLKYASARYVYTNIKDIN